MRTKKRTTQKKEEYYMEDKEFCSLQNITNFIKNNKNQGIKNYKIINELIKKGCSFHTVFDAMDKITKKGVINESIQ